MAWTWRKRKTILPGVRLNFGKKGISTTIGPRGASMTFGPNGTYVNTSIPGTGLYNRQRIDGKNKNTPMTNNSNLGCGSILLYCVSILLWGMVIGVVVFGFAVEAWVGVIFLTVVILTHFLVAVITTIKANKIANTIDPNLITEAYYNEVAKVSAELFSDYKQVLALPGIENMVKTMGVSIVMNNAPITDIKDKVRLLFWIDITRCYMGLGHKIDLNSKEGLGIFHFIALTNGWTINQPFYKLPIARAAYQNDIEAILKGIKTHIEAAPSVPEVFLLSKLLSTKDSNLHRKFLVDLYRFTSITAKADNTVTEKEAEWLSNIMKLQGSGNQEFVPEEEDEKPVTPSYTHVSTTRFDPIIDDFARYVVSKQKCSTYHLHRVFEIGFNRARTMVEQLEYMGVVGPENEHGERDVLIKDLEKLERLLLHIGDPNYFEKNDTKAANDIKKATPKPRTQNPAKMLDELIGLASVKEEVATLSNFIKIQQARQAQGLKTSSVSYHCVFTGNPGTGKTTVARILAKIYKNLGVVSKGHLVETDRAGLVAEYVGQTAVKTNKIIDSALDGVLFIDEAYSLIGGGASDYGKEAIATLLKRMEDDRDRLIVILAGYTKNMKDFIDSNPGLQSRFNRYIEFPDYSAEELLQIFEANMKKYEYNFGEGAKEKLQRYFENEVANKDANFGNGRVVRNVFEKTLELQANRLAQEVNLSTDKLSQIEIEDLPLKKETLWKE